MEVENGYTFYNLTQIYGNFNARTNATFQSYGGVKTVKGEEEEESLS